MEPHLEELIVNFMRDIMDSSCDCSRTMSPCWTCRAEQILHEITDANVETIPSPHPDFEGRAPTGEQ